MRTFANVHSTLFGGGRIRRKLLSFPAENPFRYLPIIPITQETHTLLHYGIIFFFGVLKKYNFRQYSTLRRKLSNFRRYEHHKKVYYVLKQKFSCIHFPQGKVLGQKRKFKSVKPTN